jgi:hypothetical protein
MDNSLRVDFYRDLLGTMLRPYLGPRVNPSIFFPASFEHCRVAAVLHAGGLVAVSGWAMDRYKETCGMAIMFS